MAAAPGPMPVSTPRRINYPSWGERPTPCIWTVRVAAHMVRPWAQYEPAVRQHHSSMHAVPLQLHSLRCGSARWPQGWALAPMLLRCSLSAAIAPADLAGRWAELRLPADDGEMPDDTHDTMGYPPRTLNDEYPEPIKGGVHRDGSGIQHPVVLQVSVLLGKMSLLADSSLTCHTKQCLPV